MALYAPHMCRTDMSTTTINEGDTSSSSLDRHKTQLESIITDITTAINTRQFSSTSDPTMQHMSPFFRGQPADYPEMGLEDYIKHLQCVNKTFPEWQLHTVEVMIDVDETIRPPLARAFLNNEIHGIPTGHIRPYAGVSTFKFQEGRWICVAIKEFTGFGE